MLLDPGTARVAIASIVTWLLLGWVWGDDPLWTWVRAFGATATILGVAALYLATSPAVRVLRVVVGAMIGGLCAASLGGGSDVVLGAAASFAAFAVAMEYVIGRELRRGTPSG
jgi:hypothetical protein